MVVFGPELTVHPDQQGQAFLELHIFRLFRSAIWGRDHRLRLFVQDLFERFDQWRQILLEDRSENVEVDHVIAMNYPVTHANRFTPWHLRIARAEVF